jgi:hypothetical protein
MQLKSVKIDKPEPNAPAVALLHLRIMAFAYAVSDWSNNTTPITINPPWI